MGFSLYRCPGEGRDDARREWPTQSSLRAKRSNPGAASASLSAAPGLPRRCAPRNDGVLWRHLSTLSAVVARLAASAKTSARPELLSRVEALAKTGSGDPVSRGRCARAEEPRRTGCPAFAGHDGSGRRESVFSRHTCVRVVRSVYPPMTKRAQGMPGVRWTRGRLCNKKHRRQQPQVHRKHPAFPAQWF
jgi:hypothetical protein